MARNIASLPMRMGGLGIKSAQRIGLHGQTLHMIDQRLPTVADKVVTLMADEHPGCCLGSCTTQRGCLTTASWDDLVWNSIRAGVRPEIDIHSELGEWPHGWHYYASSISEHHFRKNVVLNQSCLCPSKPEFRIEVGLFRTIILLRVRLLLQVAEVRCECGVPLDSRGRHGAA